MPVTYYDLVLGLIPITLLGITTILTAFGVGLTIAVPAGATVAGGLIIHGLFVRSPQAPAPTTAQDRGVQSFAD